MCEFREHGPVVRSTLVSSCCSPGLRMDKGPRDDPCPLFYCPVSEPYFRVWGILYLKKQRALLQGVSAAFLATRAWTHDLGPTIR